MIALGCALIGALWGGWLARKRKGNAYDMAQYAAGFGIFFGLVGLFGGMIVTALFG
ncbi:hypothetical protein [Anianabacter salinae]|uniref:hypothetical protein n=1 Tax=Anianabacter salinae TaxID=2851023 RepID=UPI00225E2047|nr:hypothetical protein [Anianabacter salinae]MBV0911600.1 hypothetical protein [Anianabacter salinae]